MLPLGGTFAKPAVVGEVYQEVGVVVRGFAGGARESVFEADQRRDVHARPGEDKRDGTLAGGEAAFDGGEPFNEGQPAHERDIFAEDNEFALAVTGDEFTVRADEEAGIVILIVIRTRGRSGPAKVVGTKEEPDMMLPDEVGDGGIEISIPAGEAGDGGFGPDQQVGPVGQGLFGKVYQLVEPVHVPAGVPD